jgi:ABC-type bacteriocin/lantibiotic exporter with double-glycine peptidase domain
MRAQGLLVAALLLLGGCGYLGSARTVDRAAFESEPGWVVVKDVPFQEQKADNDCGAASVSMVLNHWGLATTPDDILAEVPATEKGMRAGELRDLIKRRGLKGYLIHGNLEDLKTELSNHRPVIVGLVKPYVNGGYAHYEVVVAINSEQRRVATLDPAAGPRENSFEGFLQEWEPSGLLTIVVIGDNPKASRATNTALSPLMAAPDLDGQAPSGSGRSPNTGKAAPQAAGIH